MIDVWPIERSWRTTPGCAQRDQDVGLVESEKRGSFAYFSIAPGALERVCSLLGSSIESRALAG